MEQNIHWSYSIFSSTILLADLIIRIGLSLRVVMRKRPTGVSIAWLIVILVLPFVGSFFYLLFGENRLPERRIARAQSSFKIYMAWLQTLRERLPTFWEENNPEYAPLHRQAITLVGLPATIGNSLQLISTPDAILESLLTAIDTAKQTCHLQFYIWQEGGRVDTIVEALYRARKRGVICRILVDSIGSRIFLKSPIAEQMKKAGISIQESLPAGLFSVFSSRLDIRNHRKIVIIDGKIAYTGSQNMVDPSFFKKEAGVGEWIDTMVRVEGPLVETLEGTFLSDWYLETREEFSTPDTLGREIRMAHQRDEIQQNPSAGSSAVQLVPSGPGGETDAIHSLLLTTIYTARKELVMTTPYFIPDEALLTALKAAAQRGVDVKIIVPSKNDSLLVEYASRARFEELAQSGVNIYFFTDGLLHSKTITVDGQLALFGSVNLDMRSFWLNFEATLIVYCRQFTEKLYLLQKEYLKNSNQLDICTFTKRKRIDKFKENVALLVAPIL
ncbi:MAG: cardiolipin synthase [Deltaproteobacteria bacterium]|nr:MAG: cardiolipin synthase [Deltaproteobacteria bacterium]PIE73136.1 MAG: cardiolipin synthase [Deltaproteobacteria bacterium]